MNKKIFQRKQKNIEDEANLIYYKFSDKIKLNKSNTLPEKQYENRESLLTVLFGNAHIKTIQHICFALTLIIAINSLINDYIHHKHALYGLWLVKASFKNLHIAIIGWMVFYILTCLCYFYFKFWAFIHKTLSNSPKNQKWWDYFCLVIWGSYYLFCFRLAEYIVTYYQLAPASAAIVLIDQVRLLMKVHAFVRSNAEKVLTNKDKKAFAGLPSFKYYIYFTFVPALVYKDEYPSTSTRNWKRAFFHFIVMCAVFFSYAIIIERFLLPLFKDFCIRKFTRMELLFAVLESAMPSLFLYLATFYLILHSLQNLFAEILYFGDRMFYKDWWTETNFQGFFRKWNVLVHDFLYSYVYKDCYERIFPGNKGFAKALVFVISGVVHEWILSYMFGFFFPILFINFVLIGGVLTLINTPKTNLFNVILWISLAVGPGINISGYMIEYIARMNTQSKYPNYDFIVPRSLTCDCFV